MTRNMYQYTQSFCEDLEAVERLRRNSILARKYLEEGIHVRSFLDNLKRYSGMDDPLQIKARLLSLQDYEGENSGDSLRRKIDYWLKGKTVPSSRDQLVRICYALDMGLDEAQNFIACTSESGGLHYRNPVELTFLFGLRMHLPYNKVMELQRKIEQVRMGGGGCTADIIMGFPALHSESDFIRFVAMNAENLGRLHNTAYRCFTEFMDVLANPAGTNGISESTWTVRDIVRSYLDVPGTNQHATTVIHNLLQHNWPNELLLSRIRNRQVDVPRKVLALLFLVTDGADESAVMSDDLAEVFADRFSRLNSLLDKCGFCQLDPRNPFDWLVLYCMYCNEDTEPTARMREVLAENQAHAQSANADAD